MSLHYFIILLLLNYQWINTIKIDPSDVTIKKYFIQSTSIKNNSSNYNRRSPGCINIPIQYDAQILNMCLLIDNKLDNNLITPETKLIVYENGSESVTNFEQLDVAFAKGFVVNYENYSSIDGYIDEDAFYGRIYLREEVYYIEKLSKFPDIVREKKLINVNQSIIYKAVETNFFNADKLTFNKNDRRLISNVCSVVLLIDHSFLLFIGGNNTKIALSIALNSIEHANTIFRSTDFNFDGIPDNIGFQINYIMIMNSYKDQTPFIQPFQNAEINSLDFIEGLSYITNFRDGCVGLTFTAQPFMNSIIGVSYTATPMESGQITSGGFCVTTTYRNFNVITVTYLHKSYILPQMICDVSITHELGHSFGSFHDSPKCNGYIMNEKTSSNVTANSFKFSPCSRIQMNQILNERSVCLKKNYTAFCGNGLIEDEEECDCGSFYTCIYSDNCCFPFNHGNGCTIKREKGYTCHPSQGLCCLPSCTIRNISHLGLSCSGFHNRCTKTGQNCGVDGKCIKQQCYSNECIRIGLKECRCKTTHASVCQTCCYYEGVCMTAIQASEIVLKSKPFLIGKLKMAFDIFNRTKNDVVKKICVKDKCANVGFKIFPVDEFCLYNGFLGKCQLDNYCFVKMPYIWYPTRLKSNAQFLHIKFYVLMLVIVINYSL